jgi:hypothetical protein
MRWERNSESHHCATSALRPATAIKTFEAALKLLLNRASNYIPRLQAALKRYAEAKTLMNDPAAARALLERAAALTPPPAEPPDDPAIERVVAAVRVIGRRAARVTEADVREIQALAGSEPFWVIEAGRPSDQTGTVR